MLHHRGKDLDEAIRVASKHPAALCGEDLGVRAKGKIRDACIPYQVPARAEMSGRLVAGYTIIQAKSREEALEWTRRFPNPAVDGREAEIEVRQLFELEDFGPSEAIERYASGRWESGRRSSTVLRRHRHHRSDHEVPVPRRPRSSSPGSTSSRRKTWRLGPVNTAES